MTEEAFTNGPVCCSYCPEALVPPHDRTQGNAKNDKKSCQDWVTLIAKSGNFARKKVPVRQEPGEISIRPNRLSRKFPLELDYQLISCIVGLC